MQDYQTILVTVSLVIVTSLILILGVQLYLTILEVKKFIRRSNQLVDEVAKVGLNLRSGYSEVYGFISGFRRLLTIADIFTRRNKSKTSS